jgi:effector-binding domain-containing protein|nr:MerR family transcriptional regulator [uncultured Methanoregula sp.]
MAVDRIPIGKFSLITRLSPKALRLYDERGLLVPLVRDVITGYRYYTGEQIPMGVSIKTLCTVGFALDDVGAILAAKERQDSETIRRLFERKRREIRAEVSRLQQIEAILESPDASLEVLYMSLAEPVVKEVAPLRVISKRDKGVYAEVICKLGQDLCGQLAIPENRSPAVTVTGPFMSIYHDDDYREKDADVECAIPVSGRVVITDQQIALRTIPGGKALSAVYKGPYTGLHGAWSRVMAYAEEREFAIAGQGKELYYNEPGKVPDEELLTELQLPISL